MIFGIDFDGTCVEHMYPAVGKDCPGAERVLRNLVDLGHKIVLWTMRSGEELDDAVRWFSNKDIPLFGINRNPEQHTWSNSPKAYCNIYIDDAALGCPLRPSMQSARPMVDWVIVEEYLMAKLDIGL